MTQKHDVLKICKTLSDKYKNDFKGFVDDAISFNGLKHKGLTWQQIEIADTLIRDRNVCVSAGGGIGKSGLAAMLTIWFLCTHPFSRIPTTAPTRKQLKDVLWSEISFWLRQCKYNKLFEPLSEKLYIKGFEDWYAVARTVPKDANPTSISDTLAGFHGKGSDDLLIIVDEASGVPDQVFTAIEGAMTSGAYILLISNPVSTGGYYYDTINDPGGKGKAYKVLYYDSRQSPLVDKEFEQRIIDRYGKDSPMYITKVTGKPIALLESTVVAPERFDRITAANRLRFDGDILLSVDVGGGGSDPAVFCHRQGYGIMRWDEYPSANPTSITDEIVKLWETLYRGKRFTCIIDGIGPGAGVVSNLQKLNLFPVVAFIGSEKSSTPSMYKNKRSEGFYRLSKTFDSLHFPAKPPERLKKELANLIFDFSEGPINMEPKKRFVGRLGFSPDHADALMMANSLDIASGSAIRPYVPAKKKSALNILTKDSRFGGKFSKFVNC